MIFIITRSHFIDLALVTKRSAIQYVLRYISFLMNR